jgi:ribosomal protein S18 acetylase RimI-like enzyme
MSKFILTLDTNNLAGQIAGLINAGGQLKFLASRNSILCNSTRYLIELHKDKVIGTIGLEKCNQFVTEMKHLCVHPEYRRQGLGKKLLERGVQSSLTEIVFGTVRSDNAVNIRNNLRINMIPIGKRTKRTYSIIIFARRRDGAKLYRRRTQGH